MWHQNICENWAASFIPWCVLFVANFRTVSSVESWSRMFCRKQVSMCVPVQVINTLVPTYSGQSCASSSVIVFWSVLLMPTGSLDRSKFSLITQGLFQASRATVTLHWNQQCSSWRREMQEQMWAVSSTGLTWACCSDSVPGRLVLKLCTLKAQNITAKEAAVSVGVCCVAWARSALPLVLSKPWRSLVLALRDLANCFLFREFYFLTVSSTYYKEIKVSLEWLLPLAVWCHPKPTDHFVSATCSNSDAIYDPEPTNQHLYLPTKGLWEPLKVISQIPAKWCYIESCTVLYSTGSSCCGTSWASGLHCY